MPTHFMACVFLHNITTKLEDLEKFVEQVSDDLILLLEVAKIKLLAGVNECLYCEDNVESL